MQYSTTIFPFTRLHLPISMSSPKVLFDIVLPQSASIKLQLMILLHHIFLNQLFKVLSLIQASNLSLLALANLLSSPSNQPTVVPSSPVIRKPTRPTKPPAYVHNQPCGLLPEKIFLLLRC